MLQVLDAEKFAKKLKVTIQATGKLGFTEETRKELNLSNDSFVVIAQDDSSKDLYLAVLTNASTRAFQVHKSGSYYYLATKLLFDFLNVDYKKQTVIYDLTRSPEHDSEMGGQAYKMNQRIIKRRSKEDVAE